MRTIIDAFDRRFCLIDVRSRELLRASTDNLLIRPREIRDYMGPFSCGEYILRSAAMVEKAFGGITTRLWDDPFEWTLAESLGSSDAIMTYLSEVESTRLRGFALFNDDTDLTRQIPAPEHLRPIVEILLESIGNAEHYLGRAFALYQMTSNQKLPRL